MVFSTSLFLFCFLPLSLVASFLIPRRLQNLLLLGVSLLFYAWGETIFVLLMLASILMNFGVGHLLSVVTRHPRRKAVLALGVVLNLLPLLWFKYAEFALASYNGVNHLWGDVDRVLGPIHLPIGISFFTFQAISYLVDVYRNEAKAQRNPLNLALYIAFFPQLIAGPIIRYHDIASQLVERIRTAEDVVAGIRRFSIGLAKKVLIANTLAVPVDAIFSLAPEHVSMPLAWLAVLGYTLQLYFDFSGYSDMAIGLGRMFGFNFPENFNYPYVSRSVREFWQRWHISLSTWFRDYLYIPLGGNRRRTVFNLTLVFLLCGLWHGASWTFVIWGLYHGVALLLERYAFRANWSVPSLLQHGYTLLVVMVGWTLFRAESLSGAGYLLRAMAGFPVADQWAHPLAYHVDSEIVLAVIAGMVFATPWSATIWRRFRVRKSCNFYAGGLEMLGALALLVLCAVMLSADTYNPFIYFRF